MNENKILYVNKSEKLRNYIPTLYIAFLITNSIYCFVIITELPRGSFYSLC